MLSPEGQRAVLQLWANNTDVVVGPKEEPQAAFIRLAGVKGWLEGDVNWCIYWQSCFGEDYRRSGEGKKRIPTWRGRRRLDPRGLRNGHLEKLTTTS